MNQFFSPPRQLEESKPYWLGGNNGHITQRGAATLAGMLNGTINAQVGDLGFTLPHGFWFNRVKAALAKLGYPTATTAQVYTSWAKWCSANGVPSDQQSMVMLAAQANAYKPVSKFSGLGALGRLGDWASDLVSSISTASSDALSTITGAKAQQTAQQNAILLAQQNAAAQLAAQQTRDAAWVSAAPWVALGVIGLGAAVFLATRK